MADTKHCACGPPGAMPRVDWQPHSPLSAHALATDQAWRHQLMRRHNRFLHGAGVVCGLHVVPAAETGRPWAVRICPGYGLGPHGNEVSLCCSVVVNIAEWLWSRDPPDAARAIVALQPARTSDSMCSQHCDLWSHAPVQRKAASTRALAVARILWETSGTEREAALAVDICRDLPPCVRCPDDPSLALAYVKMPHDRSTPITETDITAVSSGVS